MRSSPNFLAESRSEGVGEDSDLDRGRGPERAPDLPPRHRSRWLSRDDVEFNELNISLKISYKTLVLAFVLFDVLHKIVNGIFDLQLP